MTHTAIIKFAPIFTVERFNDPAWNRPGRQLYESGAFRFLPSEDTVPLVVNHDDSREIGTVHEVFKLDWIDGPWICARATVNDPPSWLKRGTRSSFSFITLHLTEFNIRGTQAEVVAKGIVREVSVLSPTTNPAEPCAEVWSYRPAEVPPVARVAAPAAAGEVIHDWAPREPHALAWAEQARRRGSVVRIATDQVLGVR
jgi:hypothetical protein